MSIGVAALVSDGAGRVIATAVLTGLAATTWWELGRLQRALGIASDALTGAALSMNVARRNVERGTLAAEYATVASDAFDATVAYAYRIGTLNIEMLRQLAEHDPEEASRMADEALAAAAVLTEHRPDLTAAQEKFLAGVKLEEA